MYREWGGRCTERDRQTERELERSREEKRQLFWGRMKKDRERDREKERDINNRDSQRKAVKELSRERQYNETERDRMKQREAERDRHTENGRCQCHWLGTYPYAPVDTKLMPPFLQQTPATKTAATRMEALMTSISQMYLGLVSGRPSIGEGCFASAADSPSDGSATNQPHTWRADTWIRLGLRTMEDDTDKE